MYMAVYKTEKIPLLEYISKGSRELLQDQLDFIDQAQALVASVSLPNHTPVGVSDVTSPNRPGPRSRYP
jgi:hypothetical protein